MSLAWNTSKMGFGVDQNKNLKSAKHGFIVQSGDCGRTGRKNLEKRLFF